MKAGISKKEYTRKEYRRREYQRNIFPKKDPDKRNINQAMHGREHQT